LKARKLLPGEHHDLGRKHRVEVTELVLPYWHIGHEILARQDPEGWGAKIIDRLAKDRLTAPLPIARTATASHHAASFAGQPRFAVLHK
jgi:hypothetical protein